MLREMNKLKLSSVHEPQTLLMRGTPSSLSQTMPQVLPLPASIDVSQWPGIYDPSAENKNDNVDNEDPSTNSFNNYISKG